ncbi:MAG: YkgJ family cysteine cluster protein, partial [Flammeovirgaceae bacterium]
AHRHDKVEEQVAKELTVSIQEKVAAVEEVFSKLDQQIGQFQSWSGLHCKWGCGKCCFKADIEATILEFLPFAMHLYRNQLAEQWLDKIGRTESSICLILNPTQATAGLCSEYPHRGLICRLFGYSARTNKYEQKELVTCQIIKTEQRENFEKAEAEISNGAEVPVMSQYYMQLHSIDFELTKDFYPINIAIQRAIEAVLSYFAYREG